MSVSGGIVILAVTLARLLLKKAPKKWSYLMWAAAAFRLCCPIGLRSHISLFGLLPGYNAGAEPMALSAPVSVEVTVPRIPQSVYGGEGAGFFASPAPAARQASSAAQGINIYTILFAVWLAGAAGILLFAAVRCLRLRAALRYAEKDGSGAYISEGIKTPFVFGILKPRIYLPQGMEAGHRRCVLMHERCHIKRGDHIIKPFALALTAAHWFNPLCWAAFRMMTDDMELSCDEKVLSGGEDIRREYSRTLLALAVGEGQPAPELTAFGNNAVGRRIKNAMSFKKAKKLTSLLAAVLCIAVLTACTTDPIAQSARKADAGAMRRAACELAAVVAEPQAKEQTGPSSAAADLTLWGGDYAFSEPGRLSVGLSRKQFTAAANALLNGTRPLNAVSCDWAQVYYTPGAGGTDVYDDISYPVYMKIVSGDGESAESCHMVTGSYLSGRGSETAALANPIATLPASLYGKASGRIAELAGACGGGIFEQSVIYGYLGDDYAAFAFCFGQKSVCVFYRTDDGETWRETASRTEYGAEITGAYAASDDEAYICLRSGAESCICRTVTGGESWQRICPELPGDMGVAYRFTLFTPVFNGMRGAVLASYTFDAGDGRTEPEHIWYETTDGGETWTLRGGY